MIDPTTPLAFYARLETATIFKELVSDEQGLHDDEVHKRLRTYGPNVLSEEQRSHVLLEFLSNFKDPLVLILLFAAGVSFALGEVINATLIVVIVLFSTVLNFFQEYQAGKAAEELKEKVSTRATVIRGGVEKEVFVHDLVPGDIISLVSGKLIPADARIISAHDFFVNQSSLTGESFPSEKTAESLKGEKLSLGDLTNVVFFGTSVVTGSAKAVIVKTGIHTEFGKIAKTLVGPTFDSEFTLGVKNFSTMIMKITMFFVVFIFFFNVFVKHDLFEAFTFSVAVAVGLTPELLPMIMSVTMGRGSMQMASRGVIVKKLVAIPNFGSMNILCTDKTGTLTQDKITLVEYTDVFGQNSEGVLLHAYLNSLYQTGVRNPMDDAVLEYENKGDHLSANEYVKVDEIPFDFVRRKMSIVVEKVSENGQRERFIITKGAPEDVMSSSMSYEKEGDLIELDKESRGVILNQYDAFSRDGYRVLAVAIRKIEKRPTGVSYTKEDEKDLELIGFVAFLDPAKKDVKEVLVDLEKMGIEIKVITGDSELVTEKIARDVGLPVKGIMLGYDLDAMTDDALRVAVQKTTIFARFSPDQKNRVILALKANGNVVGYMGDGINDAPSLKTADVGISVNNATDIAKDSAEIILTHKSLRELLDGVLEGRKTFGNTMKYIMMGVSSNFGNMFSVLGAVLFLPYLPMLPIQILFNNFLYDFSQITIPSDSVDDEFIREPKRWNMTFIKHFMYVFGPISSVFDFITFYVLYVVYDAAAGTFQTGWFLESLATQTMVIYMIRTRKIPFLQSSPSRYLFFTTLSVVVIGWVIPFTAAGSFFGFTPLPALLLASLAGIVLAYLCVIEVAKRIFYRHYEM
ncbi:magnesium-translocating P-type ATPase [Candidatus Gracilibacteria bacterium]|nr:magnesium-translocating P-type ATPase [Candidatus Gracilibacteria bacterium]